MSGVDDRIVSMKFDNVAFEKKLSDTIGSLDKLRGSLDFANSTKGFENITSAANSVNLGHIAEATGTIAEKFNAMTVIATAALSRLTMKAVDAGVNMVKAFAFQPIKDGFAEFETNMNSIQTILANTDSKGTTLTQVNGALDQLNQYSDKTIYNFSQMARNIGTFTAAGIDLDTSVSAIKGIANLAAVSGSNAEQASTAMYQLSQALASGTVKLMDWNSVVNAGMGGEVFQKALFETGKQMKTISGVPMSMSFDQWKDSGNSFRLSLEQGWLTADVLTNTLKGFTGDLTEAQIMSMGYTKEQAAEVLRMGKVASAAATEVKTFTQLIGTVKESIGSGWSTTFRTVIGDFEQSKELFTSINTAIGGFVSKSADARNALLGAWAFMGGRDVLIEGFTAALKALGSILGVVRDAFREMFPKTTATELFDMTKSFTAFMKTLQPSPELLNKLASVFDGLFAALSIGWTVLKNVVKVVFDIVGAFSGAAGGVLDFGVKVGDALTHLQYMLVVGGGIDRFFQNLRTQIAKVIVFIKDFKVNIANFFDGFSGSEVVEGSLQRVNSRMGQLKDTANTIGDAWAKMGERLEGVRKVLDNVWTAISTWFKELGSKLAAVMQPGDFDAAVDIVNVGLLGGIALLLKKFLSGGLKLDFGDGLIKKISKSFDTLTGTLKAMQADLKAKALLKIAGAVGILTASMVVLSMIDSAALTKALVAIGVGFAQLVTVMVAMDKFGGNAAKTNALAVALNLMATAVGILSMAITNMSQLDAGELARGLAGTGAALAIMVGAMKLMGEDPGGSIAAGAAMTAMAIALRILAEAVGAFAAMEWESMAQGRVGIAAALGIIVVAMLAMPVSSTLAAGAAMIPLATGLGILAGVVKLFSMMSWEEMGQGLLGIAGALVIIAGAMNLMPLSLPITAAGLLLVSQALVVMTGAVLLMSTMDFEDMARGIGGLGVMLGILVIAMNGMNSALAGAASLVIISGALVILTGVLIQLSKLTLAELGMALGALAAALLVLGVAAYALEASGALVAMTHLGVALVLIGGGIALFGVGIMAVAKGFEVLAESGAAGAKAIVKILEILVTARVKIVDALVGAILQFAQEILNAAPLIIKSVRVILGHLLETIIELVPEIAKAIASIVSHALELIRELFPQIVETGYAVLTTLLGGIRDNIADIVTLVVDIVTSFVATLVENMPRIVESAVNLITSFLTELAAHGVELVTAGMNLLVSLIQGITDNVSKLTTAIADLIIEFLAEIAASLYQITAAGLSLLVALLDGIANNLIKVADAVTDIITKFIDTYGENAQKIIDAGFKLLTDLLKGIGDNLTEVVNTVGDVVTKFVTAVGDQASDFIDAGADALTDFLDGISDNIEDVTESAVKVALKFIEEVGSSAIDFTSGAANLLINFLNDLSSVIDEKAPEIRSASLKLLGAIFNAMLLGLPEKMKDLLSAISSAIGGVVDKALGPVDDIIGGVGNAVGGVVNTIGGLFDKSVSGFKGAGVATDKFGEDAMSMSDRILLALERVVMRLEELIEKIAEELDSIEDPTITPIVDYTELRKADRYIQEIMQKAKDAAAAIARANSMAQAASSSGGAASPQQAAVVQAAIRAMWASGSIAAARSISTTDRLVTPPGSYQPQAVNDVRFEQNIYSPQALSVNDIYRNTKSQIALAKEELEIA